MPWNVPSSRPGERAPHAGPRFERARSSVVTKSRSMGGRSNRALRNQCVMGIPQTPTARVARSPRLHGHGRDTGPWEKSKFSARWYQSCSHDAVSSEPTLMTFPSRHWHLIAAIVIGSVACACAAAARAEWIVDVAAGGAYNSNLTRAQNPQDRRPDRALTFAASIARYEALSGYDGLSFGIDLRGEVYDRYSGLDFVGIGASATYRRKFALGVTAPYGVFAASVSHDDYRVDVRDSNRLDLRAELGRRFTRIDRRRYRAHFRPPSCADEHPDRARHLGGDLRPSRVRRVCSCRPRAG